MTEEAAEGEAADAAKNGPLIAAAAAAAAALIESSGALCSSEAILFYCSLSFLINLFKLQALADSVGSLDLVHSSCLRRRARVHRRCRRRGALGALRAPSCAALPTQRSLGSAQFVYSFS